MVADGGWWLLVVADRGWWLFCFCLMCKEVIATLDFTDEGGEGGGPCDYGVIINVYV